MMTETEINQAVVSLRERIAKAGMTVTYISFQRWSSPWAEAHWDIGLGVDTPEPPTFSAATAAEVLTKCHAWIDWIAGEEDRMANVLGFRIIKAVDHEAAH